MKNYFLICLVAFVVSCQVPRNITIQYIKNDVEKHITGENSTISIKVLGTFIETSNQYLEFTAIKYNGEKFLIIGSDRSRMNEIKTTKLEVTYFVSLSGDECKKIKEKHTELVSEIKSKPLPQKSEGIYVDYCVKDDFFISLYKQNRTPTVYTSIWVNTVKHTITGNKLMNIIDSFLKY